ncbi:MAG: response regulator transcription factor [Burkholderiales bacterium]
MATLLIIEDETPIRANLRQLLQLEGYTVLETANGEEGVAAAHARQPDLVLCDILMPGMDGYAVLAALRASPATKALPFIFLTASANRSEREQAIARGADEYLVKPVRIAEVLAAIDSVLQRRKGKPEGEQS